VKWPSRKGRRWKDHRFAEFCERHKWLVDLSLALVIVIEILPLEADCTCVLIHGGPFVAALVVKLACLTLILLPLLIYLAVNGLKGLAYAGARVTVVAAIVAVRLFLDILTVLPLFPAQQ
jgi:hypothetical protein